MFFFYTEQYYLDLNEPYLKMVDLEGGACGGPESEGYLKMSDRDKTSDYLKMGLAPPPPVDQEDHEGDVSYVNEKKWNRKKEKGQGTELQPLTKAMEAEEEVQLRKKDRENSPAHVNVRADVHRSDDTDSGHSSTYAPGTPPDIGNDGYLVAKSGPGQTMIFVSNNKSSPPKISLKQSEVNSRRIIMIRHRRTLQYYKIATSTSEALTGNAGNIRNMKG